MSVGREELTEFSRMCATLAEQEIITDRALAAYRATESEYRAALALQATLRKGFNEIVESEIRAMRDRLKEGHIDQPSLVGGTR
jgi:hypothetical protein